MLIIIVMMMIIIMNIVIFVNITWTTLSFPLLPSGYTNKTKLHSHFLFSCMTLVLLFL